MTATRSSGVYYYGTQNDPTKDTFIMKTDLSLNPIWVKTYSLEQTSPYGFDVASNESYIIIITMHSSKFTIVKVNPSNGAVTEKRTNANLSSPLK
jgi:6-phosphogluconolactonase (cycloisomerase 2 family)